MGWWRGEWTEAHLSLRGRVLTLFSLIMLLVVLVGAAILTSNARRAVIAETAASHELAKKLAITAISALARAGEAESVLFDLPVQLQRPRHVRVSIMNVRNEPLSNEAINGNDGTRPSRQAPRWFAALIRPPIEITRVPVAVKGVLVGSVVITTEPSDEIAEVWRDFRSLSLLIAAASVALLLAMYWVLGRALKPLSTISRGLEQLEAGNYGARLPWIPVPDLKQIGIRFNALATKLQTTMREKESLSQQLITVQDTERKNIALELHDEYGPCLFGIKVDATFIESEAGKANNGGGPALAERARAILDIVDLMQKNNRALLYRLRPMALGHVELSQLLEDLVSGYRLKDSDVRLRLNIPDNRGSFGETVDLTIYRVVQECLTNAAQHADASEIEIVLKTTNAPGARGQNGGGEVSAVQVLVSDNGRGFGPDTTFGFGLSGMRQRAQALGGEFSVRPRDGGGTVVRISIPVDAVGQAAITGVEAPDLKGRKHE